MSTVMALNDLYSIHNYFGSQTLGRFNSDRRNGSKWIPSKEASGFKNILSSLQAHPSKNDLNIKGLTIADYRARPVISKSRNKSYSKLASTQLKNTRPNRIADPVLPAVEKKDTLETRSRSSQKIQACGPIEQPQSKAKQQEIELTEQQIIDLNVQKAATKYDLSPDLIRGVIRAESNFKVKAISSAGAQGLMQLMPATAKELGVKNPFDIEQNINGGAKYLRIMLNRFGGNIRKALAAYNAGPGTVIKYNGRVPYAETRQYVRRVLRFSRQMA